MFILNKNNKQMTKGVNFKSRKNKNKSNKILFAMSRKNKVL